MLGLGVGHILDQVVDEVIWLGGGNGDSGSSDAKRRTVAVARVGNIPLASLTMQLDDDHRCLPETILDSLNLLNDSRLKPGTLTWPAGEQNIHYAKNRLNWMKPVGVNKV